MTTLPTFTFLVDWNNDADYLDAGEDVSARVVDTPGFVCQRGRDAVRVLAPARAGSASYDLDNRSRDYSTEYASSPLVGNLIPGRRTRHKATHLAVTYDLFGGLLDDLPQHPDQRTVTIPSLGTLSRLAGKTVSTPLYTTITTDQAIGYLLDAVGWPASERSLQTGKTTLLYWWLANTNAFDALQALVNTEGPGAALYERGDGVIVFEHRHNRLQAARCTSVQATFSDLVSAALHHYPPFTFEAHLKDVVNSVTIPVNLRTVQALSAVWSLGQTLTLAPYTSLTLTVTPSGSDIFTGAIAPVAPTDYTVSSGSLSTAITLSRTSGPSTTMTITAGASGATLTGPGGVGGIQLRAQLVTKVTVSVTNTADCSASIAKYGTRTYTQAVWPEISTNVAQDFANAIASTYREPRPTATITIKAVDDSHMVQCLTREIGDRIHVREYQSGLDADMFIEQISQHIDLTGRNVVTTFGCEKAATAIPYAVWGTALWGTGVWGF